MGTLEFPDWGKHCSVQECQQIELLPFACDSCNMVFCLEHRSYIKHDCLKCDRQNVTIFICPFCAKRVHLIPDEDRNITLERHVNTDCDPSDYEKAKKKQCPVFRCREVLTFSNTIKCRDCMVDHCLKHRFGHDHKCPGPKEPEGNHAPAASFLNWGSNFLCAASSFKASTSAGVAKFGNELSQMWKNSMRR